MHLKLISDNSTNEDVAKSIPAIVSLKTRNKFSSSYTTLGSRTEINFKDLFNNIRF